MSSLNEKGVKAVGFGAESSDTETQDAFSEGVRYNLVFTKSVRFQVQIADLKQLPVL